MIELDGPTKCSVARFFFLKEEIPAWLRAKDLDSSLSLQFFMAGHVPTMFVRHLTFLLVQDVFSVALLNTGALSHFIGNMIQVYIISLYMRPTGWSFGPSIYLGSILGHSHVK